MKLLWIVMVMLSRKGTWLTGQQDGGMVHTQTVSWTYCETEAEAYTRAVKYAFQTKPGFSIDQVTVASTDDFVLREAHQDVVNELVTARRETVVAMQSSAESCLETGRALGERDLARLAVKVAAVQYFGENREEALKDFSLEELADMTAEMDRLGLQDIPLGEVYRSVLFPNAHAPKYPDIWDPITAPPDAPEAVGYDIRGMS